MNEEELKNRLTALEINFGALKHRIVAIEKDVEMINNVLFKIGRVIK